jgi:hypothetical protein
LRTEIVQVGPALLLVGEMIATLIRHPKAELTFSVTPVFSSVQRLASKKLIDHRIHRQVKRPFSASLG